MLYTVKEIRNSFEPNALKVIFKGIVSQDFEVCFLVPLDSSDIATPDGMGSFL
jgi:hypothetical protein